MTNVSSEGHGNGDEDGEGEAFLFSSFRERNLNLSFLGSFDICAARVIVGWPSSGSDSHISTLSQEQSKDVSGLASGVVGTKFGGFLYPKINNFHK